MEANEIYYDAYSLDLGHKLEYWFKRSRTWRMIYWGSGTLSIMLSALAAGQVFPDPYHKIAGWLSTSIIGFIGFAHPDRQAARYLRAYVILEPTLRDYRAGIIKPEQLTLVHRQAEEALHGNGQNSTIAYSGTTAPTSATPPALANSTTPPSSPVS